MKTFFYSLLLSTLFIAPVWAESPADEPAQDEHGIKINMDDEKDVDEEISGKELERKIKTKVLSIITDIVEAAGEDLSEDEQNEVEQDIKEAVEDIEDAFEQLEVEQDSSHGKSDDGGIWDNGVSFIEALIPLTAIVVVFGTPIMIVAAVMYFSYRKKRLMHDTINQYVSSGKDIPPEVLKGLQKEVTPTNNLHKGLVMTGIGLGMITCFGIMGGVEPAALGLIPLFIGLAQLLIWKLENK